MENYYTSEENILQLITLLKAHGVRKVVASPGTTNITFVGSIQNDPDFEVYSCVDERSACYMACGLSVESGEPVALSCTGATAARNYPSGLTEAYYRHIPIVAITSSQYFGKVGQMNAQFTDRNVIQRDIAKISVQIPYPNNAEDKWSNNVKLNTALLELNRDEGGPVHINIETRYSRDFSVKELPKERVIKRFSKYDELPRIIAKKICIFVGAHRKFSDRLQNAVDEFCEKYNAIVLCDPTSNYKGSFRILGGGIAGQREYFASCRKTDLVIHIGDISGAEFTFKNTEFWRVHPDGEVRDTYKLLTNVFEISEEEFFEYYNSVKENIENNTYYQEWKDERKKIEKLFPEFPLSNVWLCQQTAPRLPENAVLHLGILNSLRSWGLYDTPRSVYTYANVGGFGIDGILSTCIGASFTNPDKLFFCVLGDLATFYDLNVLGNRQIRNNIRIIVSNNGTGYEMHCPNSNGLGLGYDSVDRFICAGGHNGKKSKTLLKHFAEDLGFEYLKAESKEEYLSQLEYFVSSKQYDKPIIFEVFVREEDDDFAYKSTKITITSSDFEVKKIIKNVLGDKAVKKVKNILGNN